MIDDADLRVEQEDRTFGGFTSCLFTEWENWLLDLECQFLTGYRPREEGR